MTEKVKSELKAAEEEREAILNEMEKFKKSYARYIIDGQDKIKEQIAHPYVVTKKDMRKKKAEMFFNKVKKAIGL